MKLLTDLQKALHIIGSEDFTVRLEDGYKESDVSFLPPPGSDDFGYADFDGSNENLEKLRPIFKEVMLFYFADQSDALSEKGRKPVFCFGIEPMSLILQVFYKKKNLIFDLNATQFKGLVERLHQLHYFIKKEAYYWENSDEPDNVAASPIPTP